MKPDKLKNNCAIIIRMPKDIKSKFKSLCDSELVDMGVKIRQMILKELKKNEE